jgi:hypothetical protein
MHRRSAEGSLRELGPSKPTSGRHSPKIIGVFRNTVRFIPFALLKASKGVFVSKEKYSHSEDVFLGYDLAGKVATLSQPIFQMVGVVIVDLVDHLLLAQLLDITAVRIGEIFGPFLDGISFYFPAVFRL